MTYDIIIVGGGPAGLSAAIYAARALKKTLVIEKSVFGGQITQASKVENYPGFEEISGMELGEKMADQAKKLGVESIYGEVTKIRKEQEIFTVTVGKKEYFSKVVIYATGASPRKLHVENEEKLVGSGISYCATCDGAFFKGKTVCVVGGGNTAVDDALYLANLCQKVYVVHRRDSFRGEPVKVTLLKEKENVEFILNATVKSVEGENFVKSITLVENMQERKIDVDGVFVAIGHEPNTKILEDFVPITPNGYIITNLDLETSIAGFYAAGDVREKQVRQLTTATIDGTIAAIMACEYLNTL